MNLKEIDLKTFYKMFIIYNAVMDGWKVKKIPSNTDTTKFSFTKKQKEMKNDKYKEEQFTDYFLQKYLGKNVNKN